MKPVILETERLILRLPTVDDARSTVDYFLENQAFLQPWYPTFTADFFSEASWRSRILATLDEFQAGKSIRFMFFERERPRRVCGVVNLTSITGSPLHAASLGYSLSKDVEGRGLMREALRAVVDHAFVGRHLHRITANYMPRNERSALVLRNLGFTVEGYARDYLQINGRWEDHILTSLTNLNW